MVIYAPREGRDTYTVRPRVHKEGRSRTPIAEEQHEYGDKAFAKARVVFKRSPKRDVTSNCKNERDEHEEHEEHNHL